LGGQCLQVLIAARDAWSQDAKPFEVVEPSPEFADACRLFGCPELAAPFPFAS
jgi:chemotaxis protein CheX